MTHKGGYLTRYVLIIAIALFFAFPVIPVQAASLYFSPTTITRAVGQTFSAIIRVNTDGQTINASQGTIVFDKTKLEVVFISKNGSIFNLWTQEPVFSNSEGTISFEGGIPNPGYSGSSGSIITISFRVKGNSPTSVTLVSGAILANDGLGTNVLSTLGELKVSITPESSATPQPPTPTPISTPSTQQAPKVQSLTHPDSNKWYSNNDPVFKWEIPTGVTGVVLALSRSSATVPFVSYSSPISERILEDLEEGAWYFNARFRTSAGLGPIASFRFNIDTTSPESFDITRLDTDDPTNPRPKILFKSSDATSGIDRYEMKIGDGDWFSIDPALAGRAYAIPLQHFGNYLVQVKAFDRAGNSAIANTEITIEPVPIPPPFIKEIILPQVEPDKVIVKKEEVEVVIKATAKVKEVVVKEVVVKEVVVKEVVVKEVIPRGFVVKEGVPAVRVVAVIIDIFKIKNGNNIGQIPRVIKDDEIKLIKTVEVPVDEDGTFEAKIYDLDTGTYILRTYSKDERGAISGNFSEVILKVSSESALAKFITGIINAIMRSFDWMINILSNGGLLIAFILALVGLLLALVKLFRKRFGGWVNKAKSLMALKRIQKKSNQKMAHIIKDMQDEITFLNQIAKRRLLNTEEKYLKSKISAYIKTLKLMDEEIEGD